MTSARFVNFFHCRADNVGDRMSGPAQYLWPRSFHSLPVERPPAVGVDAAIIGGGQLFSQLPAMIATLQNSNSAVPIVGWGIGLPPSGTRDSHVRDVTDSFSVFGTRNYDRRDHLPFVPCASCLSHVFDEIPEPTHEMVVYLHRKKPQPNRIPADLPVMTNAVESARDAIDFISSGEIVVTTSYHGVYWAQLLGRRVICIPYNNKFSTFECTPSMATTDDWLSTAKTSRRHRPLLSEYRSLNRAFGLRVQEILDSVKCS